MRVRRAVERLAGRDAGDAAPLSSISGGPSSPGCVVPSIVTGPGDRRQRRVGLIVCAPGADREPDHVGPGGGVRGDDRLAQRAVRCRRRRSRRRSSVDGERRPRRRPARPRAAPTATAASAASTNSSSDREPPPPTIVPPPAGAADARFTRVMTRFQRGCQRRPRTMHVVSTPGRSRPAADAVRPSAHDRVAARRAGAARPRARGDAGLRRRLRLHGDVRAARDARAGGRRGGERGHERDLRGTCSTSPTATAAAC